MKLAVFTDYVYHQEGDQVFAERAFALFLMGLSEHVEQLTIVGRLSPKPTNVHYPLPHDVRFVGLPYYSTLSHPLAVAGSVLRSLTRFNRVVGDADAAWLLGPFPHAIAFALITWLRRRRVVLGVRQDLPTYVRSRRPAKRWMHAAADILELTWRTLARRAPVVVVGRDLKEKYGHARQLLEITVSLVSDSDIDAGERVADRSYDGALRVLSVGRVDQEKNPLLLAEILARLRARGSRWTMTICGEGPLQGALLARLKELGVSDATDVRGYVPLHAGLLDLYRSSHVFLHVSLTEGKPQVLTEAFASGLPVVATAVGGVPAATENLALLIAPDDAEAAVDALERIVSDRDLRERLIQSGLTHARAATLDSETARVAKFIEAR